MDDLGALPSERDVDPWVASLRSVGPARDDRLRALHDLLVRVASRELSRRLSASYLGGQDRDDLAHEVAADAMVAILKKLPEFRGESRFTTWAYKFAVLEVSNKLGRSYWTWVGRTVALDTADWAQFEDRMALAPEKSAEARELADALRSAVGNLTPRQREVFVAIVVNGVPLDAMVAKLGTSRNALYKVVFDARRKIRAELVANGHLNPVDE
ncbi:sigma-70 family RNA polymerase sigma factor [Nocardioides koreensis]|uniref:sigma-70 family RNA polymerase sigma factor n=1 Tax=Nocardioides koreensis TaxID=433651 RepID=UPI0031DE4FE4